MMAMKNLSVPRLKIHDRRCSRNSSATVSCYWIRCCAGALLLRTESIWWKVVCDCRCYYSTCISQATCSSDSLASLQWWLTRRAVGMLKSDQKLLLLMPCYSSVLIVVYVPMFFISFFLEKQNKLNNMCLLDCSFLSSCKKN